MEYPVWFVEYLTAPMLIPLIAIPHVIVAQFAVGGGIVLADMVRRCYRHDQPRVLERLHSLTRFFVLITVVFGAVTGVGIWWSIGLTSPAATSALIHEFVFAWAAEWMLFLVEIAAAFAFYYMWNDLTPREHMAMGWVYGVTAWGSLVIITAITAFMLTTGSWTPEKGFWSAFFNPSFIPQVLVRTGGSLAIASLWIVFLVSFEERPEDVKDRIVEWTSQWALLGMVLIGVGGFWFFEVLPSRVQLNLIRSPMLIIMTFLNFGITLVILGALGSGIFAGSRWITPPAAALLLLAGMVAIATGEFIREGSRKPYLIHDYMMTPGVRASELDEIQKQGLVQNAPWLRRYLEKRIPKLGSVPVDRLPHSQRVTVGRGLFRYHCSSCHATEGYNGMVPILYPWKPPMIHSTVENLHLANPAMPPWMGSEAERRALATYLIELRTQWVVEEP